MESGIINVESERVESLRKRAFKLLMILASGRRINIKKISPANDCCTILSDSMSRNNSDLSFASKSGVGFSDWNSRRDSESRTNTPSLDGLDWLYDLDDYLGYNYA
jgi:hypothetical protein